MLYIENENLDDTLSYNDEIGVLGYVRCIEQLHESLLMNDYHLSVVTNRIVFLRSLLSRPIDVIGLDFQLEVPKGIRYYGAHFKMEVFRYLSSCDGYSILVDNDVRCLGPAPKCLDEIVACNIPCYYDITNQLYPGVGREKIAADKTIVSGLSSLGTWAGGEFLGGTGEFFGKLYSECLQFWPEYCNRLTEVHHHGDEMLVSCAVEHLQRSGLWLLDVGTLGLVGRFWSIETNHVQKDISAYRDHWLVHLPADKAFLGRYSGNGNDFFSCYVGYLSEKARPDPPSGQTLGFSYRVRRKLRWLLGRQE